MNQNRYEQQKQAQAEPPQQSPEQKENLQFMSRLRELAQRQGDLNERLKELQTALQEAKTEPEKEEIRRQVNSLIERWGVLKFRETIAEPDLTDEEDHLELVQIDLSSPRHT